MKDVSLTISVLVLIAICLHVLQCDTFLIALLNINIFMVAVTLFCWCFYVLCKDLNEKSVCRNKTSTDRIKYLRWICIFQIH